MTVRVHARCRSPVAAVRMVGVMADVVIVVVLSGGRVWWRRRDAKVDPGHAGGSGGRGQVLSVDRDVGVDWLWSSGEGDQAVRIVPDAVAVRGAAVGVSSLER